VVIDPVKKREYTFGQIRNLSQNFAGNLQSQLQFSTGQCLAIFSPNCPEYIIATLGGVACGAVISPASAGFSVEELTYQLQDSGATMLITHSSLLGTALKAAEACKISRNRIFVIDLDTSSAADLAGLASIESLLSDGGSPVWTRPKIEARSDLAALPYSSGTTGKPKGVKLSHHNLIANALQCVASLSKGTVDVPPSDEIFISVLPFSHIYGT
jgi:long-subunit acyl-CoA synthetase (AMP-forming)